MNVEVSNNTGEMYRNMVSELKAEAFDSAALLTIGGHVTKMLAVWPRVTTWVEGLRMGGPSAAVTISNSGLHPAWDATAIDFKQWAQLAQIDESVVWKSWQGLVRLNLIYPDNTMPAEVRKYLILRADELLEG